MSQDPLLPIAPARVKALLLPLGKIKADRFALFTERLQTELVVHLRDISADGRPNRNMFSPLAYPDGAMLYHAVTHMTPPSHLALSPFDLYREPLAVIALADGTELQDSTFSRRHSATSASSMVERNIRALEQDLEDLRDSYPKALVHQVVIFDYIAPPGGDMTIPEGLVTVPPPDKCKRTTLKTVMCDISSLLLAEMTTLAKSFEGTTSIESPGHYPVPNNANAGDIGAPAAAPSRRNSQFAMLSLGSRPSSAAENDKHHRMSMPPMASRPPLNSSYSMPARPSTPNRSGLSGTPMSPEEDQSTLASGTSSPEPKAPRLEADKTLDGSRNRGSMQGFGAGSANDRWRLRGKGRTSIVIGSMYLQAGRWSDSLRELAEGAAAARSFNDHIWHGKALELILINLLLLGWSNLEFQVPAVCLPPPERPTSILPTIKSEPETADPTQPKHLRNLKSTLFELLERILGLYSRISSESIPPLPLAETVIRFCKILSAVYLNDGTLNQQAFDMIVLGKVPSGGLSTCPRLSITPSRQQIVNMLFRAFPSSTTELITTADRISMLGGIASVLGPLGYRRKKAMVLRELVSVLIGGLVEARTRGAAEAGIHPASGLVALASPSDGSGGGLALDLGEGDIERGLEGFLELLCKSYGITSFDATSNDSDQAVAKRVIEQSHSRFVGYLNIKLNILRTCINFAEALPDFNGVLKFSSDLLRTAGSGVAPSSRREDATASIDSNEQMRLVTNISRTAGLVQRINMGNLTAEYWDEFLVRSIVLDAPQDARLPVPHSRSILPGANTNRISQEVNPFIYNPFLKEADEAAAQNLAAGEIANFRVTLQNTYDVEVDIESIRLCTEGVDFEAMRESVLLGPYRTQILRVRGRPLAPGSIRVTGVIVKVRGCRERRFPVFANSWMPSPPEKIKTRGVAALQTSLGTGDKGPEVKSLELNVVEAQPLVVVKSTTLPQSSVMILEGERQRFSVTLENKSSIAVDMMLFSFKDSTQAPLQEALNKRDATAVELYEYELILAKRQALRLLKSEQARKIAPGEEATFDFEILGKPGLTKATIQVDYTHLEAVQDNGSEQFYTRQVSLDLTVTVNASVELTRVDALTVYGKIPQPLWERVGGSASTEEDEYCLLCMDLRNAWPSHMTVRIEGQDGLAVEESILPGKTSRVVMPVPRVYLENPYETIPSLNPSRTRQFVVSSGVSPEMERASREAFWYREKMLENLKASWRTTLAPKRTGAVELRNIRLTSRMIEAIKVDDVGIDVWVEDAGGRRCSGDATAQVDEFLKAKVRVSNKGKRPMQVLVRLLPVLCHRASTVSLDYTRKFAWNGTLQQQMTPLEPQDSVDYVLGVTALCRGEFELTASVEEVQIWEARGGGRPRSDTQKMRDAALGVRERRMWHSRPCLLTVRDAPRI
ncbi:hypothetical protein CDD82_5744 [Ophiocordyceps australis]|uniref:Hypercellular protein HypA n=1 Tax=Ophiocordyceps australis TaxID=1399860 RepID=A0A2C5YZV3_9HYPO|nr:hypothetical protein CDD82_5744 [Ophiocordyceps australis]